MIVIFFFPAKKNPGIPGKALAIVLAVIFSIFQSTNAAAASELILDNGDAGTSFTEKWKPWNSRGNEDNPYGKNALYTYSARATYTYNFKLPSAGEYQVFAWWTASSVHSDSVPYDITHLSGTSTVTVNQQENGGQWNRLGATWNFDKTATITIRPKGVGTVIADAIMLVPVETNTSVDTTPVNTEVTTAPVVNTAPVISGAPAGSVTANEGYSFQPNASDADGDQLTFSISNKPAWASFSTSSGRLSGTPTDNHVNTYSGIVISVTDGTDTVSLPAFSIQVAAAPVENTAPVISGAPAGSVTANERYSFKPSASDADGDQLTFSISNKPAWAGFSSRFGRLSGFPTDSHVDTYSGIVISVTDGKDTVSLPAFSIQVAAAPVDNTAPVISGTPAGTVTADESYSFQPSASDADNDQLTFSISNKPVWASFSTSSGRLSGTPADSHVNTYSGIVISVTDGTDAVSLPGFSIQVTAAPVVNTAPVISGAPAGSVMANEAYSFQPSASDADGDQLIFSISNKPAWASFSTSSGRLSGTPADSHVNTYSGIVISVTDGTDAASLGAFSITVNGTATQTGSISLDWTAPVARTDGTPITMSEIAGFTVYYGTSTGSYPNKLSVDDGSTTSATIADLPAGTYYLVVTTRDYEGRESGYSSEVAKMVN